MNDPLHAGPLVIFTQRGALQNGAAAELRCSSWNDFLATECNASGFFLEDCPPELQDALLWKIRASRWWDAWVALSPHAPHSTYAAIADARQTREQAVQSAAQVNLARVGLPDEAHLDFEERLLQFLFVRDGARLQPVCDRHSHYLYRFPLAEALGADENRVTQVLLDLQRRRFLEPDLPIDRVRHCRKCSSAHPHYHDVCPHCRSIQIEKTAALHCFTCGHVAPQADYMQDSKLVCPQCNANLRHIGVDYDRPLTQYACADCHHVFVETLVQVRCLDCGDVADPGALDVRAVAPLRLSARGRAALREGASIEHAIASEHAQHVPLAAFSQALGWTLRPTGHAGDASLVALEFNVSPQDSRALAMVDESVRRVHELLADTDLSTVDAEQRLWFLVGNGPALVDRVRALYPADSDARLRAASMDLRELRDERDAQRVMSQLKAGLQ